VGNKLDDYALIQSRNDRRSRVAIQRDGDLAAHGGNQLLCFACRMQDAAVEGQKAPIWLK
jgi:hypothetical protein